jgi:ABC-type nickel/cobalt efflux system permease component RcnA
VHLLTAAATSEAFRLGLVLTAFGFGFRHGIDWDHIAALTDITASQETSRRSMSFATLYALGHALVVFVLGLLAILLAARLPSGIDNVMERFVGVTLIVLGVYVFYALVRHGRDFRMRSRWMLLFSAARRLVRCVRRPRAATETVVVEHEHAHDPAEPHPAGQLVAATDVRHAPAAEHHHGHRHVVQMPDDPFMDYSRPTAFGIGMIHGVGAETPTQVLIFLTAAGAGGKGAGVLLLVCFLAGLLASNTLVALASTFGYAGATRKFWLYATVSVVTATFSLLVGGLFLFGKSTLLPALFGG